MSEPILMALVQLFAIVAASVKKQVSGDSRRILESYLGQHLHTRELDEYLKLFDELLLFHRNEEESTETQDVSDKISSICLKIRKQLTAQERMIVFIKFLEFTGELRDPDNGSPAIGTELSDRYAELFRTGFNLGEAEFEDAVHFINDPVSGKIRSGHLLLVSQDPHPSLPGTFHLTRDHLDGMVLVLFIPAIRTLIARYLGGDEMYLNGNIILPFRSFVLSHGAILKNQKIAPVYYSDVATRFLENRETIRVDFTANEIEFRFKNSDNGIHPFSFTAGAGELVGVMGGSGAGKSTLLNVLNGNLKPCSGEICINGYNLTSENEKLRGMIGFVPQDDLLVDELTVFQNLYFNARLCFRDFTRSRINRAVMRVLRDIGLDGIRHLTVGDPLNKFISGGQRKRLNIALELIREPAVLFADEPTSGLSSMDSEMVMLLLKEQTLKGRLVIVNIHQPSSDIFKLFDKLLILDKGGYPVYFGNPIDALTYFKTASSHVNPNDSECQNCGYVNPEQILQIIESKLVNEYGRSTASRKRSPKEWYTRFRQHIQPHIPINTERSDIPTTHFKVPGLFTQFRIFSLRNLLSKITNRQYMLINLLEAPLLAALLAYLTRYRSGSEYIFGENRNLVAYLFMSVVVSLFLGMMVSAEEIIRDRRILKREAFLHLSRFSYINSKILLLFGISAIQTFLYVLTGNLILEIRGMTLPYWLILFTTACTANLIGLNISSGMKSVVAIYILIPFILVPQLLLSGTIVPFDYLNPTITSVTRVPVVGDLMASRWTFEALAVEQFKNNRYEKNFYTSDRAISKYEYITSYVIPTLKGELDDCQRNIAKHAFVAPTKSSLVLVREEIDMLSKEAGFNGFPAITKLTAESLTDEVVQSAKMYLDSLSSAFSAKLSARMSKKDHIYQSLKKKYGAEEVYRMRQNYRNESLADLVMDKTSEYKILNIGNKLVRKMDPVYMAPVYRDGRAHLYAPEKYIGNIRIDTFWFNLLVIWMMTLFLYAMLWHDTLRKVLVKASELSMLKRKK